jgi:addiction module RelE/StbE family toxin
MLEVKYAPRFKKQYKKLSKKLQQQFDDRLQIFLSGTKSPQLRIHPLVGKYFGYWSMSMSGDLRALYRKEGDSLIIFALIGTHSVLYG